MWPLFLIGGAVIVGGWLWGASKVASNAPPLARDTFTSPTKIQVGDIVDVALVSTDTADTETSVQVPANLPDPFENLPSADLAKVKALDASGAFDAGVLGKFLITAVGLTGPQFIKGAFALNPQTLKVEPMPSKFAGRPVSIGVVIDPQLSVRIPFYFLDASVRSVTRNGKQVG
jgi:hypothetical protein